MDEALAIALDGARAARRWETVARLATELAGRAAARLAMAEREAAGIIDLRTRRGR